MRCFKNIAKLIRTKRQNHPKGYSQSELSNMLGYKNGQFISNVERALCNIPLKMLSKVSVVLDITRDELKQAILLDHEQTINNYLNADTANTNNVATMVKKPVETNQSFGSSSTTTTETEDIKYTGTHR
jgi:transcriptional regulator with XRE-family HTH domain